MGYTENEIAEAHAMRDITLSILGDTDKYTHAQLRDLRSALTDNREICVDDEKYHLAEVFNDVKDMLPITV